MQSLVKVKRFQILKALMAIIAIAIFLVATAIAILLAQGRTLSDDGPVQTSIIKINSVPRDTEVYLDNQRVFLNDGKIEWVQPGLRSLRLVKLGYRTWENTIKVEPGIVREVFAQLYPEQLDFVKLTQTNIDKVVFSENREFVYYTVLDETLTSENGLWRLKLSRNLFDFGANTPALISNLSEFKDDLKSGYSLMVSSDNNRVLLSIPDKSILQVFEVNRLDQSIDLLDILGFYPDSISWFRGSEAIIVKEGNLLFEFELNSRQKNIIEFNVDRPLNYSINTDFVYFYRPQTESIPARIYKYKNKTETAVILPTSIDVSNLQSIYTVTGFEDTLILKFENSVVYINEDKSFVETINNVSQIIRISDNARVILFQRDDRVFIYSLENTVDNLSFVSQQNPIEIDLENIENLQFTPNNRSIIYLEKPVAIENQTETLRTISVIDIDGTNNLKVFEDARIDQNTPINISGDSVNMYILINEEVSGLAFTKNIFKFDLEGN